jgi:PIN domain nuclease of toxin-antitoxin system
VNLLLDTHVLIWWIDGSKRLRPRAKNAMFAPGVTLWISSVSAWEIVIKSSVKRLKMERPPEITIPRLLEKGFRALPINIKHALAVRTLPPNHKDPFERMHVTQAQCEDLILVTADPAITAYDIRTIDASE